jgi:hypothetical protein
MSLFKLKIKQSIKASNLFKKSFIKKNLKKKKSNIKSKRSKIRQAKSLAKKSSIPFPLAKVL